MAINRLIYTVDICALGLSSPRVIICFVPEAAGELGSPVPGPAPALYLVAMLGGCGPNKSTLSLFPSLNWRVLISGGLLREMFA